MASIINASSTGSGGLISTADASGQLELQANGSTKLTVSASGVTIPTMVGANVSLTSNVTGTLPVANGGTGAATLTSNNVLLGNGTSAVQFVAPGTNGNVLTSNGTTWQSTAPAGGGSWIYLSTVTASNSATVDVETTFSSTYDVYALVASGIVPVDAGVNLRSRVKISGVYDSSSIYSYHVSTLSSGSTSYSGNATFDNDHVVININSDSTAGRGGGFVMYIHNPSSTSFRKIFSWTGGNIVSSSTTNTNLGFAQVQTTTAMTGIRFYFATGNVSTGTFRLYGIKNS